jgi:hypothetical protein
MENNINNLQKNILEKIKAGEINMRSKSYFALHFVLLIILALLILLTSSFLISFIYFSIHASGRLFLLGFGWRGFEVFVLTFPWTILLVDVIFLLALEWLLKRFQFGYRNPLIYSLGGILLVTLATAFVISETSLHDALFHQEQRAHVPFIGAFYDRVQRPPHESGVFRGVVLSLAGNTFTMADADQDDGASSSAVFEIILDPSIVASGIVATSDTVFVAGDVNGNTIHAYGIRKLLPTDEIQ